MATAVAMLAPHEDVSSRAGLRWQPTLVFLPIGVMVAAPMLSGRSQPANGGSRAAASI